jgi:RecA-family ATPase
MRFDFTSSPDLDRLALSMRSFEEVYDDFPALVIVDNITNVWAGGVNDENPYAGLEITLEYLHQMSRDTGSAVVVLHHVTGPYNDGDKPIPLSGIKGQIGRLPELILTMHRVPSQYGTDSLNVSTVKNRGGWQDPSGKQFVSLDFEGSTMQIKDQV